MFSRWRVFQESRIYLVGYPNDKWTTRETSAWAINSHRRILRLIHNLLCMWTLKCVSSAKSFMKNSNQREVQSINQLHNLTISEGQQHKILPSIWECSQNLARIPTQFWCRARSLWRSRSTMDCRLASILAAQNLEPSLLAKLDIPRSGGGSRTNSVPDWLSMQSRRFLFRNLFAFTVRKHALRATSLRPNCEKHGYLWIFCQIHLHSSSHNAWN